MGLFDFFKKKPTDTYKSTPVEKMTDSEIITKFKKDMKEDLKTIEGTQEQAALLERIDRAASSSKEIATVKKEIISKTHNSPDLYIEKFKIHDDIKSLLWFGDGPQKNLTKEQMFDKKDEFTIMGNKIKVSIFISTGEEPSLIYVNAPIIVPQDESVIHARPISQNIRI